jgi:hypothetical protein
MRNRQYGLAILGRVGDYWVMSPCYPVVGVDTDHSGLLQCSDSRPARCTRRYDD